MLLFETTNGQKCLFLPSIGSPFFGVWFQGHQRLVLGRIAVFDGQTPHDADGLVQGERLVWVGAGAADADGCSTSHRHLAFRTVDRRQGARLVAHGPPTLGAPGEVAYLLFMPEGRLVLIL